MEEVVAHSDRGHLEVHDHLDLQEGILLDHQGLFPMEDHLDQCLQDGLRMVSNIECVMEPLEKPHP